MRLLVASPDICRTLAARLRQLFEAGYAPDEIAVKEQMPEACDLAGIGGPFCARNTE